jgi:hypothetical protein
MRSSGRLHRSVSADDSSLVELEFSNSVMRESLRLHPASGVGAREAATDVTDAVLAAGSDLMELTLITSRLAQRVDLEPTASHPPAASGLIVSRPVGGAPMRVTARSS